tara:strand:+ start:280 stop:492 length:213 start_codon:yes stop_codon:yes gene_type:complete
VLVEELEVGDLLRYVFKDRSWIVIVAKIDDWGTMIRWPDGILEDIENYTRHSGPGADPNPGDFTLLSKIS